MAKTLSFTDTSPQIVKIGDTTTSFTLICGNDNVATDLTSATSITVKFGNASGYLKSATVDPASLTDPTTGQVTVKFNSDLMTNLPAGSYFIEVWVVDSAGTSIYPSDGPIGFNITNNIQSANGSTITTITFDDFVKELNKVAASGIPDGTISFPKLDNQLKSNFLGMSEYTPQSSGVGGVNVSNGTVTGFGTQTYWSYAQYNVAGNINLYVSFGKSSNTAVTGHIFATDDNNKILASFVPGGGDAENIDNYAIVTPEGTTKLFIQSYLNYKISVGEKTYQSLSKSIEDSNTNLKQDIYDELKAYTPQVSGVGGVNVSDGTVTGFGTQTYWSYAQYDVGGNLNLNVSFGKSSNTAVTGHIFATDDNNKILASFVPGGGDAENIDNYEIVTPDGTTKLFIQSYSNYKISVNGSMYQTLLESIEDSNTNLKQEIDDELKIYKEINNSNVYNFISRQGMLDGYPENSNEAVLHVKQNGFNHVRVSVAFTSDNVPVLIHDASINKVARNSDGSTISSTINIADITLAQANTYDWGIVAGQSYKGMTIPLLSDFLKICSFKSICPTLEFKPYTATDDQLKSIINMVNEYGLADKTYFTSTVDAILLSVNKINPSINIGFIAQLNSETLVDRAVQFKTDVNKVRIDMFDTNTPSIDVINYASSKGVGIKVGSAYSLADIVKFSSMGVTDIEVANVAFPATALNEYYDSL